MSKKKQARLVKDLLNAVALCEMVGFDLTWEVTERGIEMAYVSLEDGLPTGAGIGTKAMSLLTDVADRHSVPLLAPPTSGRSERFFSKLGFAWPVSEAICGETDLMMVRPPNLQPLPCPGHVAPLLVLVHPGSLCGSADMNFLDDIEASESARKAVADELDAWTGDIIVLHNDLADELDMDEYATLGAAIERARKRCWQSGRLFGESFDDHPDAADLVGKALRLAGSPHTVKLTGAWHHTDEPGGCVNETRDALISTGAKAEILDSALRPDMLPAETRSPFL